MNRIIRTLAITAPLATAVLTMTPGVASAETPAPNPGPVIVLPAEPADPAPKDIAIPAPKPPKDIANPEPQPVPGPQVPDDKALVPPKDDEPEVPGPGEITDVPDCTHGCEGDPTPDFPLDGGCFEGCDLPEEPQDPAPGKNGGAPQGGPETGIVTPTRVDAGLEGSSTSQDPNGMDLTFVLIGGALVTATGAAYAARARSRQGA